ncbi:MAG: phosphatidylserine/phosphatidylglycerophosphate/cardiolipin synthase family protein [Candidatus Sericytochromatia bacterium]
MSDLINILLFILIIPTVFIIYDYFYTYYIYKKSTNAGKLSHEDVRLKNESDYTYNNDNIKLFVDGNQGFPEIEKLIYSAKSTIFIEIFIFHYDPTGIRIANLLIKKMQEGVEVKVLIDSTGLRFGRNDRKIIKLLKKKKVDVRVFNINLFSRTGINLTHRKMIIVDGESSIIGGMNFGREYEEDWHDAIFLLRGQISQELQKEFLFDWKRAGGKEPNRILKLNDNAYYGNIKMKILKTDITPDNVDFQLYREMHNLIHNAKDYIYMTSPYFSDDGIIDNIIKAKKRKVIVNIVISKENNHYVFKALNLYTAKRFVSVGIDVYFYKPKFSHLKAYIFDNKAIVGSANIDQRSFTGNQEIGVLVEDKEFVEEIKNKLFIKDIEISEKVTEETVKLTGTKKIIVKILDILDYYL